MASYKVIQDIEAEDKLVGPFTLRQFIYAGITALCSYFSFIGISKHFPYILVIFLPIGLFTGFFAIPWGRDQPTEVWALAKIRFFLKPRRRIWDQSGMKNLVNVTAPKHVEKTYTNNLSQIEVQSRLNALANTLDSRGWAVKNVNANLSDTTLRPVVPDSDRLIGPSSLPQEVSTIDLTPGDDMLDERNNRVAQQLDQMVSASTNSHRQRIMEQLSQPAGGAGATASPVPTPPPTGQNGQLPTPADYWFLNRPLDPPHTNGNNTMFSDYQVVLPGGGSTNTGTAGTGTATGTVAAEPTADERALAERLKEQHEKASQAANYQHMKIIQPLGATQHLPIAPPMAQTTPPIPVTPKPNPAKMVLAYNNDLNVSAIERIANKEDGPPEVVISLHDHSS